MIHQEAEIADLRRIVDLRPMNGANQEYAQTDGEPNEKGGAGDRPNWGEPVTMQGLICRK